LNPDPPLRLALYEPDIPQNTSAILRTCACLGVNAEIIGPTGFILSGTKAKRAGMDYLRLVVVTKHDDWNTFQKAYSESRRILLTTKSDVPFTGFQFLKGDTLIFGQESKGVPETVHKSVNARLIIPMESGVRSLNLAASVAMVLGEALRQLDAFPKLS
tara:strand:- start:286 stop:762 length:477 start_codon:yes stop_codon:yes gene_type:complete